MGILWIIIVILLVFYLVKKDNFMNLHDIRDNTFNTLFGSVAPTDDNQAWRQKLASNYDL